MSKSALKKAEPMVVYKGRSVPKNSFRAFVFNADSQQLANSYEEYQACLASKQWFATKEEALKPKRVKSQKAKENDTDSAGVCE